MFKLVSAISCGTTNCSDDGAVGLKTELVTLSHFEPWGLTRFQSMKPTLPVISQQNPSTKLTLSGACIFVNQTTCSTEIRLGRSPHLTYDRILEHLRNWGHIPVSENATGDSTISGNNYNSGWGKLDAYVTLLDMIESSISTNY